MKLTEKQKHEINSLLTQYLETKPGASLGSVNRDSANIPGFSKVSIAYLSDMKNGRLTTGSKNTPIDDRFFLAVAKIVGYNFNKSQQTHFETDDYMAMVNLFEEARRTKLVGCNDAPSRYGKTYTSWQYKQQHQESNAIFIVTCQADLTHKGFMQELAIAVGLKTSGSCYVIRKEVVKHIKSLGKESLLIIDESENMKDNTWGSCKAMVDDLKGVCGIVFNGTNDFEATLRKKADSKKQPFPQMVGRIEEGLGFNKLEAWKDVNDIKPLCAAYGVNDINVVNIFFDHCRSIGILLRKLQTVTMKAAELNQPLSKNLVLALIK